MFGDTTTGWYLGTTMTVKSPSGGSSKNEISVGFDDGSSDTFAWPSAEVEKVADLSSFYPSAFHSGDVVDALFQNGCQKGRWYRGRIAEVRNEQCDILYYDKEVSCITIYLCFILSCCWMPSTQFLFSSRASPVRVKCPDKREESASHPARYGWRAILGDWQGRHSPLCWRRWVSYWRHLGRAFERLL